MTSLLPRRAPTRRATTHASNPNLVLGLILAAYLMIVLDVSVIITALPEIHTALHFSSAGLSWVQNAYALTFGGLLLLGARAGDILGRRRVFMVGIALFSTASLLAGLAQSAGWLLTARAMQGVGAALAAPSTLALLTTTLPRGHRAHPRAGLVQRGRRWRRQRRPRARRHAHRLDLLALGHVHQRAGRLVGVVLWRHAISPRPSRRPGRFDLTGAITSTLGMTAVVYGFVGAASNGWGDRVTVASFTAGATLLVAFIVNEMRAEQPITPLRLFASRERSGAYLARVLVVGGMFSMFFFLTQFLQGVLGYNPLQAGLAFLPMTAVMFSMVQVVPRLTARVGAMPVLLGGLTLALTGMLWISRLSDTTAFFPGIAVPLVLLGSGMGMALTPLTGAGIAGVAPDDAGAASGVVNVAQQLGGSLGLGILVTVFASAERTDGGSSTHALAHAVSSALTGSAILLALALTVVLTVMHGVRIPVLGAAARYASATATR